MDFRAKCLLANQQWLESIRMTKPELDQAIEIAKMYSDARAHQEDRDCYHYQQGKSMSEALLHLAEAVREADSILDQINPDAKMSDTRETLARRVYNYGAMAKEWRAKYGGK